MANCCICGDEAEYSKFGLRCGMKHYCRECVIEEYGLCSICENREYCDDKPEDMTLSICSNFEEAK